MPWFIVVLILGIGAVILGSLHLFATRPVTRWYTKLSQMHYGRYLVLNPEDRRATRFVGAVQLLVGVQMVILALVRR